MHNLSDKDLVIAFIRAYDDVYNVSCDGDIITAKYDDGRSLTLDYGVMRHKVRELRASNLQDLSDFIFDESSRKTSEDCLS